MIFALIVGMLAGMLLMRVTQWWRPKERRAFITGSLKYGDNYRNEPKSDVDLVVFIDPEDQAALDKYTSRPVKAPRELYDDFVTSSRISIDGFDLILVSEKTDYDHWRKVTNRLAKNRPLTRDDAVAAFKADRPPVPGKGRDAAY